MGTLIALVVNGSALLQPKLRPLVFSTKLGDRAHHTLLQMHPVMPGDENNPDHFLAQLNDGTDPGIPYSIIAGNTSQIRVETDEDDSRWGRFFKRMTSRGHYNLLDKRLFKKPNDIAVQVSYITDIPGRLLWQYPPTTIEVPCDHVSYFDNEDCLKDFSELVIRLNQA